MENADLLTAAAATIEWLREEVRLEEQEVTVRQTRLETLREFLTRLEGKPRLRRGRPPRLVEGQNRSNMVEMPDRAAGGIAEVPSVADVGYPEPEHAA